MFITILKFKKAIKSAVLIMNLLYNLSEIVFTSSSTLWLLYSGCQMLRWCVGAQEKIKNKTKCWHGNMTSPSTSSQEISTMHDLSQCIFYGWESARSVPIFLSYFFKCSVIQFDGTSAHLIWGHNKPYFKPISDWV